MNNTHAVPVVGALRRMGNRQTGKIGWAILWLLGIPLPVLLAVYLIRGCH